MAESVRFQHYEVLRRDDGSLYELGRGAMGITYKAFDTSLRIDVALKVINATYLNSETARQRFLREARAAAAIRHANVATVFHLGNEDDAYFYAMEFIDGETVESFMQREGAVPTLMALEIVAQVSRALGAAAKQGLVHRDIKPSNLMLVREGGDDEFTVKVIDFGLAKAAEKGESDATLTQGGFLGTPHFASPEQLEESELDVRSDIYSLGVTFYYMLAGRTPFSGSLAQVMSQHLHREPPMELLADQPRVVIALLERMMAKDPDARPQTPADLRREVEDCVDAVSLAHSGTHGGAPAEPADADTITDAPREPSALDPAPGVVLAGRIDLLEKCRPGEYGQTYKARDRESGEIVAVLILDPNLLPTSGAYTRLENEVTAVQSVRHPAVIRVHSLERAHHLSFVTREWVEGPSLLDAMRKRGTLPAGETIEILTSLAGGLEAVQKTGVPCPVLSAPWITLVKDAQSGATLPRFNALNFDAVAPASPDATMVGQPGPRDIVGGAQYVFELAVLAYRMLGGMAAAENPADTFIPIAGVPEEANLVLRRAMKSGAEFATPVKFVAALEDALGDVPATAPKPPALPTLIEPSRPAGVPVSLVVSLLLVLVAGVLGGAIYWMSSRSSPTEEKPAPTPAPAVATPAPLPTPEPTPTPDARQVALDEAVTRAEDMAALENYEGALHLLDDLFEQYPEAETRLKGETDKIAAKLGSETEDYLTDDQMRKLGPMLEAASQRGSTPAQMLLGRSYLADNPKEAFKYFLLAATDGRNSDAMYQLGDMYASGQGADRQDWTEAVKWFEQAGMFQQQAVYALGECYFYGNGVKQDYRRAYDLLQVSANQNNNRQAQVLLGDMYREGLLGKPNYVEAARLWRAAAAQGNDDARTKLIVMLYNGEIVNGLAVTGEPDPEGVDKTVAFAQFKQQAANGNRSSMFYYAMCLLGAVPEVQDTREGRAQMIKAATMGDDQAQAFCRKNGWKYGSAPR